MKNLRKNIKKTVDIAKTYPEGTFIEHNIEKLPLMKGVKKNEFLGIKAERNESMRKNTMTLIYRLK